MLNIQTDPGSTSTASMMDTDELLRNLERFPSPILPVGLLRELQSRGDTIHDSLVTLIGRAIESAADGRSHESDGVFFAFALLVPIAKNEDRPLIESLLTLPDKPIDQLIGDLVTEAMARLIANSFKEQSASEWIEWIERLADHPKLEAIHSCSLFRAMTMAVLDGHLDRDTAIHVLVNRLKKRADQRYDLQSALVVCELLDLSAYNSEEVDAVVRASFGREQIDTDHVGIESWDEGSILLSRDYEKKWIDPAAELSTWTYEYVSDDLDPVNATYRANAQSSQWSRSIATSVPALIAQLRQSTDTRFPRDAVESIDRAFVDAYHATIALIREEVARYKSDSDSWSGNGAYLGLVLTVAHRMPLPTDLLEAILQMPQKEREQVFGDQFDLIVQAVALTPLKQHDFIEQWIWDADRCNADRRDMVDFYSSAYYYRLLDRELAINALVAGLQRALLEEPILVVPYAENLAFLSPRQNSQVLDETFRRDDVEWRLTLPDLRRMAQDAEFASDQFHKLRQRYRDVIRIITTGIMFDLDVLQEKPQRMPTRVPSMPTQVHQPRQEVASATTIRNEVRTPQRNAPCPCGSGKKYKKCCLNK